VVAVTEKKEFGNQVFNLADIKDTTDTVQYALDNHTVGKYTLYYCFNRVFLFDGERWWIAEFNNHKLAEGMYTRVIMYLNEL
jgi:hypothetical protein